MTSSGQGKSPISIANSTITGGGLAIVIVNWNSGQFLKDCLASLHRCEGLDRVAQVVVIDNASHDQSHRDLPSLTVPLTVVRNETNRGFAAACNQGAAACRAEYLLFLNPDTVLHANSLQGPLDLLDDPDQADVGICGIQLMDDRGRIGRTCSRLPTPISMFAMATRLHSLLPWLFPPHFMKEWDHQQTRDVEEVIGAFFVARRDLFQRLNGFDERFFVYFEEVDFCERSRRLGYRTLYLATAQADHSGGGCSNQIRGRSLFYSLRSRVLYANKHFSTIAAMICWFATFVMEPVIRSLQMVLGLRFKNLRPLWYANSLLWWDRFIAPISPGRPATPAIESSTAMNTKYQTRSAA